MNDLLDQGTHFKFGKNWLDYAAKIDERKIAQAVADLRRLAGREQLDGLSFLDIGCGSGLHTLAAVRLGAARAVGLDIDPDSVVASRQTLSRFAPRAASHFDVCSIFDVTPASLGTFDIVYSWGVLHHTGDMRRAIETAAGLVAPEGLLLLALYRKTPYCGLWRLEKRWYSGATERRQKRARQIYIFLHRLAAKVKWRDFDAYIRNYSNDRGMDFCNDVHDWLGGYPYESISPPACRRLLASLGFDLEREFVIKARLTGLLGSGCDEYAFRRTDTN